MGQPFASLNSFVIVVYIQLSRSSCSLSICTYSSFLLHIRVQRVRSLPTIIHGSSSPVGILVSALAVTLYGFLLLPCRSSYGTGRFFTSFFFYVAELFLCPQSIRFLYRQRRRKSSSAFLQSARNILAWRLLQLGASVALPRMAPRMTATMVSKPALINEKRRAGMCRRVTRRVARP